MPQWAMAQRGSAASASSNSSLDALIPERMLIPHGAIEAPLRHIVARGGKVNRSELRLALILGKARRNPGEHSRGSRGGDHVALHRGHAPLPRSRGARSKGSGASARTCLSSIHILVLDCPCRAGIILRHGSAPPADVRHGRRAGHGVEGVAAPARRAARAVTPDQRPRSGARRQAVRPHPPPAGADRGRRAAARRLPRHPGSRRLARRAGAADAARRRRPPEGGGDAADDRRRALRASCIASPSADPTCRSG